jgi:hypothetical protein
VVEVNDPRVRDTSTTFQNGAYTARRGNTTNIRVFDEGDLVEPTFQKFHCHGLPWRDSTDGSVRISFAPRRGIPGADDANRVRGVVIMDGATWSMRSVTYEYVRDGKSVGHGGVTYTPVDVDGSTVAMPAEMTGDLTLSGRFGLSSLRASWTITQTHSSFVRVPETAQ